MGSEVLLYLSTGKNTLIARAEPQSDAKVNQEIPSSVFNMEKAHLFDKDTARRIILDGQLALWHSRSMAAIQLSQLAVKGGNNVWITSNYFDSRVNWFAYRRVPLKFQGWGYYPSLADSDWWC